MSHIPVLLQEVMAGLSLKSGGWFVDGTFGGGSYTKAMLDGGADKVVAFDRDPEAIARGSVLKAQYGDRLILVQDTFSKIADHQKHEAWPLFAGLTLDLGMSSFQIDTAERGFSFRWQGPLDMRMSKSGPSAADLVNEKSEAELCRIFRDYGDEKFARPIARRIVERRLIEPYATTDDLKRTIGTVLKYGKDGQDPATKVFQALRIVVNNELGELEEALEQSEHVLAPQGRLAIVSFHSLEDRMVKQYLAEKSGKNQNVSRHMPVNISQKSVFRLISNKAIKPSADEEKANPRSRSARLRVAEKLAA